MKITTLRTSCPDKRTCPSVHIVDKHPERLYVIVNQERDPEIAAAFASRLGDGEVLGWVPAELLRGEV